MIWSLQNSRAPLLLLLSQARLLKCRQIQQSRLLNRQQQVLLLVLLEMLLLLLLVMVKPQRSNLRAAAL